MALIELQCLKNACDEADTEMVLLKRSLADAESKSRIHTDAYVAALELALLNQGNGVISDINSVVEYNSLLRQVHSSPRSLKRRLPDVTFIDENLPSLDAENVLSLDDENVLSLDNNILPVLDNSSSSDRGDIYQRQGVALTYLPTTLTAMIGNNTPVCVI